VTAVTGSVHQDQRDRFPAAGSLLREVRKAGRLRATVTFDLVLLLALLLLTALFGRPFSRIGLDSVRLYITELAIALIACAALLRCGIREAYARIRAVVPVVVLLAYWGIGAIAALRGISTFGLRRTTQDIGLVEYSIFVPLVAVVVDTPAKRLRRRCSLSCSSWRRTGDWEFSTTPRRRPGSTWHLCPFRSPPLSRMGPASTSCYSPRQWRPLS
jgi:hypothetical protein